MTDKDKYEMTHLSFIDTEVVLIYNLVQFHAGSDLQQFPLLAMQEDPDAVYRTALAKLHEAFKRVEGA